MTATLEFERPAAGSAALRRVRVTVDGRHVAVVRLNSAARVPVPAGARTVQAHIDWCHSEKVVVECADGAVVRLRVEFAPFLQAFLFTFVAPSKVLRLSRV